VIGELGGRGSDPSNDEAETREIQYRVVTDADANALFASSSTSQYIIEVSIPAIQRKFLMATFTIGAVPMS
jgi:hypothetical protein